MREDLKLVLRVVTLRGIIYDKVVRAVKVRNVDGLMIINKNYCSAMEELVKGEIVIYEEGDRKVRMDIENSWLTVSNNRCDIYTSFARAS